MLDPKRRVCFLSFVKTNFSWSHFHGIFFFKRILKNDYIILIFFQFVKLATCSFLSENWSYEVTNHQMVNGGNDRRTNQFIMIGPNSWMSHSNDQDHKHLLTAIMMISDMVNSVPLQRNSGRNYTPGWKTI